MGRLILLHNSRHNLISHLSLYENAKFKTVMLPALVLVFLLVIISSIAYGSTHKVNSEHQSKVEIQSNVSDNQVSPTNEDVLNESYVEQKSTPAAQAPSSGNTVSTSTKVVNGKASTEVTVNGQSIPINNQGSTHRTITSNGQQTQVDVQVQTDQNTASSGSNSTMNSSYQSVQYNFEMGGN